ncbi:hypothetical protein AYY18_15385 [Morganella psychrotolerans]|uniref:Uncharacterized protein n=1 Tax=Morganella psychrotolerans TaxID=368603 RepID=A0A1B8HSD8_9GAMM|nr:hypothetical protein AYY18_15385 [Morganella psychrotolerans]
MELLQFKQKYIKYNELKFKVFIGVAKKFSNNRSFIRRLKDTIDLAYQQMTYDANLADILKPGENAHSLILKKILSYKKMELIYSPSLLFLRYLNEKYCLIIVMFLFMQRSTE